MFSSRSLSRFKSILRQNNILLSRNAMQLTPRTYEGDGKTSLNILNDEPDSGILINAVSQVGFRLSNDVTVLGSIALFPRTVLSWRVAHVRDITPETLSLFTILAPKLDILIIGIGDKLEDNSIYTILLPFMRKHNINLEVLPTEQACTTFNFLNSEGRYVACALIPPAILQTTDDDLLQTKLRYQNLYEVE